MEDKLKEKDEHKLKKRLLFLVVLCAVMLVLIGGLTWTVIKYNNESKIANIEKNAAVDEKKSMILKLEKLQEEYDLLSQQNEDLDNLFKNEKEKVKQLLDEIKGLNGSVDSYKFKVVELEKRLKVFVSQIEELKAKNNNLTLENGKVKSAYDSTSQKNKAYAKANKELEEKVKLGSLVKATDIIIQPERMKSAGSFVPTQKAKKADRLKIHFVLNENLISKNGWKEVFIRIAQPPNGEIIRHSENSENTFDYNGNKIFYTTKIKVFYNNKDTYVDESFSDKTNIKYTAGIYDAYLFMDGFLIGHSDFKME